MQGFASPKVTFRLLIVSFTSLSIASALAPAFLPPVIFVPGYAGARLDVKLDKPSGPSEKCARKTNWIHLWLNASSLSDYVSTECWADNARLIYDPETHTTSSPPGVQVRVPGFGNMAGVDYLDPCLITLTRYFSYILNKVLLPLGYKSGISARAAPYDFRKAPNEMHEYFKNLKDLIEESYQQHGNKVLLLTHSMGSPITANFLNAQTQAWKDKHIQTFVSLGGAWGGSVKILGLYTSSLIDDVTRYLVKNWKTFWKTQRTFPSLAYLMPSPELWDSREVLLQSKQVNVTTSNFKDLFTALSLPDAYNMYLDNREFAFKSTLAPGVEIHCVHGVGVKTTERLVFANASTFPDKGSFITGDGDGTVNKRSSEACLKWRDHQTQEIIHLPLNGVSHLAMMNDDKVLAYLREVITEVAWENKQNSESVAEHLHLEKEKEDFLLERIFRRNLRSLYGQHLIDISMYQDKRKKDVFRTVTKNPNKNKDLGHDDNLIHILEKFLIF